MSTILLRNGRVIDPSLGIDAVTGLWIQGTRSLAIGSLPDQTVAHILDCTGMIVCPGLIDMHVHLREPGREEDETIATGTAAAVAGGVTSVACMPNTEPTLDTPDAVRFVVERARATASCNVFPIAAVTKNRAGHEL